MAEPLIEKILSDHLDVVKSITEESLVALREMSNQVIHSLSNGGKVILCGNGGSAADAQHFSAELLGRFVKERRALAAIALTTDTSTLTAIANDYSYNYVFERQVEALANRGDIFFGISTSGNSENVLNAAIKAKKLGCKCFGFLGGDGGSMLESCDLTFIVPSKNTARIQEIHLIGYHVICELVDLNFN